MYHKKKKKLFSKQIGFQSGHSTEHAILQLANQIHESFENNLYTSGVFIDLSKPFGNVNHSKIIKKLEIYGIHVKNHKWFNSYLRNRKQYIQIDDKNKTHFLSVTCGVPQGSISEPLLLQLYVNDLPNASNILDPIMYADDTNLFFSNCDIPVLFATVNSELSKITQWFLANKLLLNVAKTKYSFFYKTSKKEDIPLKFPRLQRNNYNIDRIPSVKFQGVSLAENLSWTWKDHIKYTENKISKNIGILYKARNSLSKESLLSVYYAYIHTYINYANLAWASTIRANLKKIHTQQKHTIRIIFRKYKFSHTKGLFVQNKVFNTCQLNILNKFIFMHKVRTETAPAVFPPKFKNPAHPHPTNFSKLNYIKQKSQLCRSKYRISCNKSILLE